MLKIVSQLLITTLLLSYAAPLKKTGQIKSYDTYGNEISRESARDDGHYQAGVAISYSRSGDVVIDDATGLQWQDNESIQKLWVTQANYNASNYSDTSGDTAATYCSNLSLDGGGWRLPSIEELETIVDDSRYYPSVTEGVFQHISPSFYWSSTSHALNSNAAWRVYFPYGHSQGGNKEGDSYVRCVRGGQ